MNLDHYNQLKDLTGHYPKLVKFIKVLRAELPLSHIDTNDWQCNTRPSVYVHNKKNMFKLARYSRCSKYDIKLALKFFNI
jgi:hypothetical protein